jgi:hypothetical protein
MASNAQKTPLARTLNQFAERKVIGAISLLGRALPAKVTAVSGSIVTVAFQVNAAPYTLPSVTVPLAGPEYSRPPTQRGDLGVVFPADAYLGGVSGLGGGVADLKMRANLSSLVFFPIGNKGWGESDDPNSFVIWGPDGVILRTGNKSVTLTLSSSGIAIKGDLTVTGEITAGFGGADSVRVQTHTHPTAGTGAPSPPTPGT